MLEVVEAAYRLELDDEAWLTGIAHAASALFGADEGVIVHQFEYTPERFVVERCVHDRGSEQMLSRVAALNEEASAAAAMTLFGPGQIVATMSERLFERMPEVAEAVARNIVDFEDGLGVVGHDGMGRGVAVVRPLAKPREATAAERGRWSRIAPHLGAGLRLRRRLSRPDLSDRRAEALVCADGRVRARDGVELGAGARERLRLAAHDIARARVSEDEEEALQLWQGLVEGRWSLVDHIERDGDWTMIAWRNDPEVADPRGLTQRERQVSNALGLAHSQRDIAYAFGITEAAVSRAIRRSVRKLGLGGATQLAQLFAPDGIRWRLRSMELSGESFSVGQISLDGDTMRGLSEAEQAVLLDLLRGATYRAVAEARGASQSTIANQVQSIFDKLGVSSRVEAAVRVLGEP